MWRYTCNSIRYQIKLESTHDKLKTTKGEKMSIETSLNSTQETDYTEGAPEVRSVQMTARFAGMLYLIITIAAIVAHIYVPSTIIVTGDAAATANNIRTSETLFRVGAIGGELIVLLSEIVLSVVLYVLLRPVNKTLSLLAAVSRLAMTTIHGLNLINYFVVLLLLGGSAGTAAAFDAGQINALVGVFLEAHSYGFTIGIVFLTLHVFALGYLIFKSGYFPKILGVLFLAAAVGYLIDSFALLLSSTYTTTPVYLALPITLSEIAFPLWLLIKGVNIEGWKKRALTSG
jgi:hypothetical protein